MAAGWHPRWRAATREALLVADAQHLQVALLGLGAVDGPAQEAVEIVMEAAVNWRSGSRSGLARECRAGRRPPHSSAGWWYRTPARNSRPAPADKYH
jgi:hypothetical protein